jgi:hypothetical protein
MAATLANRGVNPVTGVSVIPPNVVARTLSVMTSSGMYDYAGEWIYRVGIPAKSGVGGGIVAALPSQMGLGTFSPNLDSYGNSVRGLKVCEALSSRFDLHMLNRSADVRTCIIADYEWTAIFARISDLGRLRRFALLDEAIEWAEDQIIYRYGGFTSSKETSHLGEQALLADLAADEIAALAELSTARRYEAGQRIVSAGEPANSLFFLQSGMVSVKLPSGVRLASLGPGMEFGEMAIIETHRSADVWADTAVKCLELPLDSFADYRRLHPQIALKIMRNLSALLARRLILANAKVDLLSAY